MRPRGSFWNGVYRRLFWVLGPAQLGDASAPVRQRAVPDAGCSLCGRPNSLHLIERSGTVSRMRCPVA